MHVAGLLIVVLASTGFIDGILDSISSLIAQYGYPAVFAAHGGWRLHVRATLLRAHGRTVLVDTGVGLLPFFVFDYYFFAVEPMLTLVGLLDAVGNVAMLALCYLGWKASDQ